LNWRVVAYATIASVLIAAASAIIPMLRIARADPGEILKAGAATMTRTASRRDALVVVQLALALVLLFCTGILVKSATSLAKYDFGYDPGPLAKADIYFLKDPVDTDSAFRGLVTQAARLPGIEAATLIASVGLERGMVTADEHSDSLGVLVKRSVRAVDPSFFRTLRVPVIAGRDFQPGDEVHGAVIVDQEAARKLWRGDSVVGRTLKLGDPRSARPWLRVVGVIKAARIGIANDPYVLPEPGIFVVQEQLGRGASIVVRTATPPVAANDLRRLLRERLRSQGRNYYSTVGALKEGFESMLSVRWFMASLFAVFAAFTLALALAGIYGTLSYSVSRRMREFGVRRALGATDVDLRKLVLIQAAIAILAAIAIGGPAGLMAARLLDAWLYGVWYTDAVVLVAAEAVLIVTAFVVCIPAMRRAASSASGSLLREL
jgi:ABC-type antimicrobial peptide transport system permease subunit